MAVSGSEGRGPAARQAALPPVASQVSGEAGPGEGHLVIKLGRFGLRCAACFAKAPSPYQAWRRGRCGGAAPLEAVPAHVRAAIGWAWDRQLEEVPEDSACRFGALVAALSLEPRRLACEAGGAPLRLAAGVCRRLSE